MTFMERCCTASASGEAAANSDKVGNAEVEVVARVNAVESERNDGIWLEEAAVVVLRVRLRRAENMATRRRPRALCWVAEPLKNGLRPLITQLGASRRGLAQTSTIYSLRASCRTPKATPSF